MDQLIHTNLFITITNANFDDDAIADAIRKTLAVRSELAAQASDNSILSDAATWASDDLAEMMEKAKSVGVLSTENEDIRSLRELITYGLKGMAAYLKHASALKESNPEIDAFLQRALAETLNDTLTADDLIALSMETGKYGVGAMALLDHANTTAFGNPEITDPGAGGRRLPRHLYHRRAGLPDGAGAVSAQCLWGERRRAQCAGLRRQTAGPQRASE